MDKLLESCKACLVNYDSWDDIGDGMLSYMYHDEVDKKLVRNIKADYLIFFKQGYCSRGCKHQDNKQSGHIVGRGK